MEMYYYDRLMANIGQTRKEREKLVVDLYKQGMNYAQIAKEARMSLRDIGPILNRSGEYQSLSYVSQVFKMLKEGHNIMDIAIALNLREKEVSEYYREYWNLNGKYQLSLIYEEIGNEGLWSIVELYKRTKSEGLTPQQVTRILKTTTTLQRQNIDLDGENARLEVGNKEAAKTFQRLTDLIQKDQRTLEENDSVILRQKREIENLDIEKARREQIINSIRLNNQTCIKVKQIVKREIESIVSDPRKLIKIALASLFQSSRKHPGKLQALYYNTSPLLSVEQILSQPRVSQIPSSPGYAEEEKLLLDDAEEAYNSMMDAITNRCINEVPNDAESLSPMLPLPIIQEDLSPVAANDIILDTGDLSQVNFVYNDITFQVYPTLKITNERSSRTDMLPQDYELDNTSFRDQE
jgi:hypothetical protein